MVTSWATREFRNLDLKDARRNRRAVTILEHFSQICESQPEAAKCRAVLKAQYRFIHNKNSKPEDILEAHNQASIERTKAQGSVILVQDTSEFDLTKPRCQVAGAGPLEHDSKRGFYFHPLYAVSEEGVPLGIVDQQIWTREFIKTDMPAAQKSQERKQAVYEEKESARWLEMMQSGEQIARANPDTEYIIVSDSESDIHEVFLEADTRAENCHFVVRACQNRAVVGGEQASVDAALAKAEVQYVHEVDVHHRTAKIACETRVRRVSRTDRTAKLGVRACTVTIRGPARAGGRLPDVTINVVESFEIDPPSGEEPLRWLLFTTMPISSVTELQRIISAYGKRWHIELFFKTLKSGLKCENLQYETLERYWTAFSLLIIVGWRVEALKGAARHEPDASCEEYFAADEWQPAYYVRYRGGKLPPQPPTIQEFMYLVAELGGWQRTKRQGPPGSTTIWRGMRRIAAYTEAFQAFQGIE